MISELLSPTGLLVVAVAFVAGLIRGFAGFGGPAFLLAILTFFMTPMSIINKVLIMEVIASGYLFYDLLEQRQIRWRSTWQLTLPTLVTLPFGYYLLEITDPEVMKRVISFLIVIACFLMMFGFRLRNSLTPLALVCLGLIGGVIFGASYIALIVVTVVLMTPDDKNTARSLIISWCFIVAAWFAALAIVRGNVQSSDWLWALPMTVFYFTGTWLGSRMFNRAAEQQYRKFALYLLLVIALAGLFR